MQNNYDYNIRREVLKHISYRKLGANFNLLSNAPVCAEKNRSCHLRESKS